jgi:LPXTG-motif cell wall-anchored protein
VAALAVAGTAGSMLVALPLVASAEPVCACEDTTTVPDTTTPETVPETTTPPTPETTAAPATTAAPTTAAPVSSVLGVTLAPVPRGQELPATGGSTQPLIVVGLGSVAAGAAVLTLVTRRRTSTTDQP